jgi:hypothetical protein
MPIIVSVSILQKEIYAHHLPYLKPVMEFSVFYSMRILDFFAGLSLIGAFSKLLPFWPQ